MAREKRDTIAIKMSFTKSISQILREDSAEMGLSMSAYVAQLISNARTQRAAMRIVYNVSPEMLQDAAKEISKNG